MGGAPSRETLVRGIVREPTHVDDAGDSHHQSLHHNNNSSSSTGTHPTHNGKSPQPEIVLIPLITEYFPNAHCPLFQQLLAVRREPSVMYYNRDSRSNTGAGAREDVMPESAGSDAELFSYYMNLSEQRLVETDNDLVALHRTGRAYTPVPCAVAFVYDPTSVIPALSAACGAEGEAPLAGATAQTHGDKRKSSKAAGNKKGGAAQGKGKKAAGGAGNGSGHGYMTLENTVRLPRQNIRVRIFGFIGDTRLSQPFMLPVFAAKSPVSLGLYLSKSAGGNHRTQVTLLAAYTYISQLRQAGVVASGDFDLGRRQGLHGRDGMLGSSIGGGAAAMSDAYGSTSAAYYAYGDLTSQGSGADGRQTTSATPGATANGEGGESSGAPHPSVQDSSAGMRLSGMFGARESGRMVLGSAPSVSAFEDAYQQASTAEAGNHLAASATAGVGAAGSSECLSPLVGLAAGASLHGAPEGRSVKRRRSQQLNQDELQLFLHPIAFSMHRSDVPALCYIREMRFRMAESSVWQQTTAAGQAAGSLLHVDANTIQTSLSDGLLRGYVANADAARLVLWGAEYYAARFDSLTGGEATKFRTLLAQRNLVENAVEGQVYVSAQDPATGNPLSHLAGAAQTVQPGDVWITAEDTFVSATTLALADRQDFVGSLGTHHDAHGAMSTQGGGSNDQFLHSQQRLNLHGASASSSAMYSDPNSSAVFQNDSIGRGGGYGSGDALSDWEGKWLDVPAGTVFRRTEELQWSSHATTPYVPPAPRGDSANASSTATASTTTTTVPAAASAASLEIRAREHVEDILLTVCRAACNDSRRAPPADPHWVVNAESGLPEGLLQGLVIWRDACAGQSVFYGTTPDFVKKWTQAGLNPAVEYIKVVAVQDPRVLPGHTVDGVGVGSSGKLVVGVRGYRGKATDEATGTAGSSGRNSGVAGTGSSNYSDTLLRQQDQKEHPSHGSGGAAAAGSGEKSSGGSASPISVYSVRTGFVRTPSEEARLKKAALTVGAVGSSGSKEGGIAGGGHHSSSNGAGGEGSANGSNSDSQKSSSFLTGVGGRGSHGRTPPKAIPVSQLGRSQATAATASKELVGGAGAAGDAHGADGSPTYRGADGGVESRSVSISDVYYRTMAGSSGASTPMHSPDLDVTRGRLAAGAGKMMAGSPSGSLPVRIGRPAYGDLPSSSSSDAVATSFKQGGHSPSSAAHHANSLLRSTSWTDSVSSGIFQDGAKSPSKHKSTQPLAASSVVVVAVPPRKSSLQVSNTKFSVGSAPFARSTAGARGYDQASAGSSVTGAQSSQQQKTGTLLSCSYTSTNRRQLLSASPSGSMGGTGTLLGSSPLPATSGRMAASPGTGHKSGSVKRPSLPEPQQPVRAVTGTPGVCGLAEAKTSAAPSSAPVQVASKAMAAGAEADASETAGTTPLESMSSSLRKKEMHRPPPLVFPPSPPSDGAASAAVPPPAVATDATASAPVALTNASRHGQPTETDGSGSVARSHRSRSHHHHAPEPQQPIRASISLTSSTASAPHQSLLSAANARHTPMSHPPAQAWQPEPEAPAFASPSSHTSPHPHMAAHLPYTPQPQQPQAHQPMPSVQLHGYGNAGYGIPHKDGYDAAQGMEDYPHTMQAQQHPQPPYHHARHPSHNSAGGSGFYGGHPPVDYGPTGGGTGSTHGSPHYGSAPYSAPSHYGGYGSGRTGSASTSMPFAVAQTGSGGGVSMRIPIARKGIDDPETEDYHNSLSGSNCHGQRSGGGPVQGTPTQGTDSTFRPSSARSSVGNGRYRWDWRAATPTLSSSFKGGSMK